MSKKGGGGGNDGFKLVKSSANKKDPKKKKPTSTAITGPGAALTHVQMKTASCKDGSNCTQEECANYHDVLKCTHFADCPDELCKKRHRFLRELGTVTKICSAGRFCNVRSCPYFHDDPVCAHFYFCGVASCTARHGQERSLRLNYNKIELRSKIGDNVEVDKLWAFITDCNEHEHGDVEGVDPSTKIPDTGLADDCLGDAVIALDTSRAKEASTKYAFKLRGTAFSCKLVDVPLNESGTKQVVAFTTFTLNVVDQGVQLGKLNLSTLNRARKLHEPNALDSKAIDLWGGWACAISFRANRVTATIAATTYYDIEMGTTGAAVNTVRVIGESAEQPEHPLRLMNVKLSRLYTFADCSRTIRQSMTANGTAHTLPASGCRVDTSLVLAGSVSAWCSNSKAPQPPHADDTPVRTTVVAARMNASMVAPGTVRLAVSYRTRALESEVPGRKLLHFVRDNFAKLCNKHTDTKLTSRMCPTVIPTAAQLRQLRTLAGGMPKTSTYREVVARLKQLGYFASDVAQSVGCDMSMRYARMSDCTPDERFNCTNPLRSFISCYHQFIILNAIDPDSPAAGPRKALFDTLPPLDELLVQWTTKYNSMDVSRFKCTEAVTQCLGKLIPDTVVPVRAVVVRPPQDCFMNADGFITVYVPHATPPPCLKSPPVIIKIPAGCARDKDGTSTFAFDTTTCATGRTVLLMVSLRVLSTMTDGMTVSATDGSVTLVPEVPLSLVPKLFRDMAESNRQSDTCRQQYPEDEREEVCSTYYEEE